MREKIIYITAMILPFDKGKRKVVVTGAAENEMPLAVSGLFPQLHEMIDQVWLGLSGRGSQTVHHKASPPRPGEGKRTQGTPQPTDPDLSEARRAMVDEVAGKLEDDALPQVEGDPRGDDPEAEEADHA